MTLTATEDRDHACHERQEQDGAGSPERLVREENLMKYHLSKAEAEIMEMLWEQVGPIRQTYLLELFRDRGKGWERQTLNTMLMRLEDRGIVKREKRMVWACYDRQGYGLLIIQQALNKYFDGKVENMLQEYGKNSKSV